VRGPGETLRAGRRCGAVGTETNHIAKQDATAGNIEGGILLIQEGFFERVKFIKVRSCGDDFGSIFPKFRRALTAVISAFADITAVNLTSSLLRSNSILFAINY
jgi:hypothetical protein